jgi:hypothetical protein
MSECEEEKLNIDILAEERGYVSNEKHAKNSRHELGMLLRWLSIPVVSIYILSR